MQPWRCKATSEATLIRLLLITGLVSFPSLGCRQKPGGQNPLPVQVTIACPTNVSSSLVMIANGKGYFARGGTKPILLPFETGKESLQKMLDGGADLAVVAETPVAHAILGDAQLKVLASIQQSGQDVAIVARKDKGIRSPADLRGKVIGYTKGTSGHFFLDTYCLVNRISQDATRFIDLSPLQLRSALLDGRVDAVSTWEPHVAFLASALDDRGVVFRDGYIYAQCMFVVARPEFIRDHPAQVKVILEGLFSALDLVARSPGEARDIVAAYTRVDPSLVSKVFAGRDFDVRLDQSHILSLDNECRWFVDSGAVPRREIPRILDYFYLPGLLAVRPQAVQIIRDTSVGRP